MKKGEYEELLESVQQGGAILRGEVEPSRVFKYKTPKRNGKTETRLAICVRTDDRELLVVNKIYPVNPLENNLMRVIDEAGEAALYDEEYFLYVSFPPKVERVLARLAKA
jgi:hypothetical protein